MTIHKEEPASQLAEGLPSNSLDIRKFELECRKADQDFELRKLELEIKRQEASSAAARVEADVKQQQLDHELRFRELTIKEMELRRSRWNNPLVIAILTVAATLGGNILVQVGNIRAQRDKAESDLVVEAIKSGDPVRARENLLFLADAGRLTHPDLIKASMKAHSPSLPTISAPGLRP